MLQVRSLIGACSKDSFISTTFGHLGEGCRTGVPDASCTSASFRGFLSSPAIVENTGYIESFKKTNNLLNTNTCKGV
jgi:hypothetical protein